MIPWQTAKQLTRRTPFRKPAATPASRAQALAVSRAIVKAKKAAPRQALKTAHVLLKTARKPGPSQAVARRQIAQTVALAKRGNRTAKTALGVLAVAKVADQKAGTVPAEKLADAATEAIENLPGSEEESEESEESDEDYEEETEEESDEDYEEEDDMQADLRTTPSLFLDGSYDNRDASIVGSVWGDFVKITKKVIKSPVLKVVAGGAAIVFPPVGVPASAALVVADQVVRASEKGNKKAKSTIANTLKLADQGNKGAQTAARVIGIAASSRALAAGDPAKAKAITAASKAAQAARNAAQKTGWTKTSHGAVRHG